MSANLSCSRIPHLARAIAEKRCLKPRASIASLPCQSHNLQYKTTQAGQSLRFISSKPQPKVSYTTPPPLRRPTRRAPPTPVAGDDAPHYDPSKDSKKVSSYLIYVSCFAAILGTYVFYVVTTYRIGLREYNTSDNKLAQDADVSDRWHDGKRNFDNEVDGSEWFMGLKNKRRKLIREAYGDVLEVSVGTGRNMDLYDTRPYSAIESSRFGRSTRHMITSLTFNDQSSVMIQKAQEKWESEQKSLGENDKFTGKVDFITGDARIEAVIPRPAGGYDTIIQSMGVCSMAEPAKFLRHLGRLVRQPNEPVTNASVEKVRLEEGADGKGGRIFLLEHGRAYESGWPWYDWLNRILDGGAGMHANRYGCWYNKDIGKVIKDSGLIVEREKRYHFGTVWEIVLRPPPGQSPTEASVSKNSSDTEHDQKDSSVTSEGVTKWITNFWR